MPTKKTKPTQDTFRLKGEDLLKKVKNLINEGNIREITIKDKNDNVILVLPLTIGVVGAVLAPPLAVVGTLAALVTECTLEVKRK